MFKPLTALAVIASFSGLSLPAHSCDMHGAGFGGFESMGAHWKPYSPAPNKSAFIAPEEKTQETAMPKPLVESVPVKKAKPRFSNAANRAALAAKKSIAQKSKIADSAKQPL